MTSLQLTTKSIHENGRLIEEIIMEKSSYYAVCPECENPIQLIGLFKDTKEAKRRPYGRHHGASIPNLAEYDEQDYIDCRLSDPNWTAADGKRNPTSRVAVNTLAIVREQFDRVIYILNKQTGLSIRYNLAKKMLMAYISDEGWLFRYATMNNIPWIFAQCSPSIPLFGQLIKKDSELHKNIKENCSTVRFEEEGSYVRIKQAENQYVNLYCLFLNHETHLSDDHLIETIEFWVYEEIGKTREPVTILKKVLPIETDYFMNLIQADKNPKNRSKNLLSLAAELL